MGWVRFSNDLRSEGGFSLLGATIALGLTAVVLTSVGQSLVVGLRVTHRSFVLEQATTLATRMIESAREVSYDDLSMRDGDLAGDARILSGNRFDPDESGPLASEPVVTTASGGSIDPHITVETIRGRTIEVARYVTWVDGDSQGGADRNYKRLTVVMTWDRDGLVQTHRSSALISRVQRGMPVPKFEFTPDSQSKSVAPGEEVVFPHTLRNRGIVDAYDLGLTVPQGRVWTVNWYEDLGELGAFISGVDRLLTDTNGTGVVDTGNVVTDATINVIAVWTLAVNEAGGTVAITATATSGADAAVAKTATDTLTIGSGNFLELSLHDEPTPPTSDQASESNLSMNDSAPTAATLYKYSTDHYTGRPGRFIDRKNTDHTETDKRHMANWVFQLPATTTFQGNAEVSLWVAMKDFACDKTPELRLYLREKNSRSTGTGTQFASAAVSSPPQGSTECGFRQVTVTLPVDRTIDKNKWLELKVTVAESTADAALIAYDTSAYPGKLKMPRAST